MNFPRWTIVPDNAETCSREKLIETLKIADKIIHAYVSYLGHDQMLQALHESDLTTKEEL